MTNCKQSNAAGADKLHVNVNYSELYYYQNLYYIRFYVIHGQNRQIKAAKNPVRHNKYPEVKQYTANKWAGIIYCE